MARIRPNLGLRLAGLVAAVLVLAGTAGAQSLTVQVQPSRSRGVAPLAVLFDATGTRAASSSTDAFHDLEYVWDFGDPGSGNWGPSGKARNEAFGPLAGHVFEKPGTYTIRVRVSDSQGRATTKNVSITVDPADTLQTFCFATDNSNWNDPAGACQGAQRVVTSNFAAAMSNAGPGRRLLFRRGDRFGLSGSVGLSGGGPVVIGAFGNGAAPIVDQSAFANIFVLSSLQDYRIMDLDLRGTGRSASSVSTYLFQENGALTQLQQLTLLRITGSGQHNAINMTAQWGAMAQIHEELAVVDCLFHNFADSGRSGSGVRIDANRSMFLGNQVLNNERNEFNMRTQHLEKVVIEHNFFDRPADQKGNLTVRACNWFKACGGTGSRDSGVPGVGDTREFIIADNHFRMAGRGAQVSLNPQNRDSFEVIREGLVERNLFEGVPNGLVQTGMNIHASDVTVRNNIFDSSEWWSDPNKTGVTRKAIQIIRNSNIGVPDATNVRVLNNTMYDGSSWPGGVEMLRAGSGSGHEFVNNLLYAPNMGNAALTGITAGLSRQQANLMDGQGYKGNPFVSANPVVAGDFRLSSNSPVRDAGAATPGVLDDFAGNSRPSGGAPDVGAFEVVSQGGGAAPAAPVLLP